MFKRILVCLILMAALITSPIMAMEEDQTCNLIPGSKIIQIMPDRSLRGVIAPSADEVTIGPKLSDTMVQNLNMQSGMDWTDGNMGMISVDFGQGPMPVILVLKQGDVKDCK